MRLSYAVLTAVRDVRKFRKRRYRQLFSFYLSLSRDAINFFFSSMKILHARCSRRKLISELIHRYIFGKRYISRSINRATRERLYHGYQFRKI